MYYFVYYINIIWTSISSHFKERTRFYSLMVLNRAGDVPAADWLSQTQVKNSRDLSRVVIRFFSVVEIPIKHPEVQRLLGSHNMLRQWQLTSVKTLFDELVLILFDVIDKSPGSLPNIQVFFYLDLSVFDLLGLRGLCYSCLLVSTSAKLHEIARA